MQSKVFRITLLTVNEIPFTAIEPLWDMNFFKLEGNLNLSNQLLPILDFEINWHVESIWPNTKWPDTSSPILREFSKLIIFPTVQYLALVLFRVSYDKSAVNFL